MERRLPNWSTVVRRSGIAAVILTVLLGLALGCAGPRDASSVAGGASGFFGPSDRDNVVVFVHGVMGSPQSTWRNASTGAHFPALIQTDPELRDYSIYLLGYASPTIARAATITEVAARELQRLKDDGVLAGKRRVVIVAHSMGGLVAKRMIVEMNRPNLDELDSLDRVKGVIFLSTPAMGAPIAEYASWLSLNPQFANMKPADFNAFLQALEDDWQNMLRDRDLLQIPGPRVSCAYETQPTAGIMVVSRVYAASRCDANPLGMDLSHTGIASPASASNDPYGWVKARIRDAAAVKDLSRKAMLSEARGTAVASALPAESQHLPLVLDAADPNMVGKGSIDRLFQDIKPRLARGERITSLTFDTLPGRDYYAAFAIDEYLKVMRPYPAFRYVVFLERGRYVGWMPATRFAALFQQQGAQVTRWINAGDFAALREQGMQEGSIPSTATALDALNQLEKTGAPGLGVIAPDGKLVGIASRSGIVTLLVSRVVARQ
jgi:pimeloyl-ACP methyl ester carboxylesterase